MAQHKAVFSSEVCMSIQETGAKEIHKAVKRKCLEQNGFTVSFTTPHDKLIVRLINRCLGVIVDKPSRAIAFNAFRFIAESEKGFNESLFDVITMLPNGKTDAKSIQGMVNSIACTREAMKPFAPKMTKSQEASEAINQMAHRNEVCRFVDKHFYRSREWRELRLSVLATSRCCKLCGASPLNGVRLHVDHIKPRSLYPELSLDPSNLQILCADCNMAKSNIVIGRY